MEMTELRSITL